MKVTYFIGSTTGGGAEHVICELATYMSEHGHQSEILTVTETDRSYYVGDKVIRSTIDTRFRIPFAKVRLGVKMVRLFLHIMKNDTDLYVVFLPETIKALMLFKKFIKVPVVVSERSNPESYSLKTQERMIKEFRKAEGAVFQTESAKAFYMNHGQLTGKTITIPNAITGDLPVVYEGQRLKEIVSVGRFKEEKNFPLLIKAFAQVRDKFPDYKLVIYGEGELKSSYIKLCNELNIMDSVIFPGFVDNIPEKIKKASVFVSSSDYEGMSNALIEALAMGIPCVATDCGGGSARFLIDQNVNGILSPVGDVTQLATSIIRVLEDENFARKLGLEAQKAREYLSKNSVYSKWKNYLEQV